MCKFANVRIGDYLILSLGGAAEITNKGIRKGGG
jgi:hypothetical protein